MNTPEDYLGVVAPDEMERDSPSLAEWLFVIKFQPDRRTVFGFVPLRRKHSVYCNSDSDTLAPAAARTDSRFHLQTLGFARIHSIFCPKVEKT
jgi:hypothetical protein